jgi:hypothetical protein
MGSVGQDKPLDKLPVGARRGVAGGLYQFSDLFILYGQALKVANGSASPQKLHRLLFRDGKFCPYGRGIRSQDALVTQGSVGTNRDAMAANHANAIMGYFRKTVIFAEPNDRCGALASANPVFFAFIFVNNQIFHLGKPRSQPSEYNFNGLEP